MCLKSAGLIVAVLAVFALISGAPPAWAHCAGNHTGDHPHCQGAGQEDPKFEVESADPYIPAVTSYSLDFGNQIVFRGAAMDLGQFVGSWDGSGAACDHGYRPQGIIVLAPKSNEAPVVAAMTYWFQSELESGATVQYFMKMEGQFDEPANWPPSEANTETTLTFNYWEISAENKKAQRSDCAGSSDSVPDPNGPWTVTVRLQP